MKQLIEQFKKLQGDNSPTIGNELVFRDIASDTIYIKSYTEAYKKRLDAWVKNNPSKWGYVTEDEFRIVLEKTNKVIEAPIKVEVKEPIKAEITEIKDEVIEAKTEIEPILETTVEKIEVTEKPKRGRKAKI